MSKKVGCVIFYNKLFYEKMAKVAHDSFVKWHKDEVECNLITPDHLDETFNNHQDGVQKFEYALAVWEQGDYDKLIVLGADTITCARLDEFLDNDEDDVLATLDYPYNPFLEHTVLSDKAKKLAEQDEIHVNADVVCFNNKKALTDIVTLATNASYHPLATVFYEQGALNHIIQAGYNDYTFDIVDHPYHDSSVVYNARVKGNICAQPGEKPWGKYTKLFYIENNKLFTNDNTDNKQIKVFHYCDGFGCLPDTVATELMNRWIFEWFNEDTKQFFKEHCNAGNYFEEPY